MQLYSTNDKSKSKLFTLTQAVAQGLAPDGGLFMPTKIPKLKDDFWERIKTMSFQELSFEVARTLIGDNITENMLEEIVYDAISFNAPLVPLENGLNILELFHGPTLAFKDFGGRFMARLMRHIMKDQNKEITILVATSGDTGSAVAHGFYKVPGFRVVLLFPKGKVSKLQEMQFATLGENIDVLEVDGAFDDCQRMVKEAFVDKDLRNALTLTSANSINIARLIPQSFYYFNAYKQLLEKELLSSNGKVVFSIPSGNFGNLTAGLFAKAMGLPIHRMIASTNVNAVVPRYLNEGIYETKNSIHTISNAMDIGNPSNFARMMEIFPKLNDMKNVISGFSFSDDETRGAIKEVFEKHKYVMCPHTAVGYLGLKEFMKESNDSDITGVVLSTAHPAKFNETVESCTGQKVEIPERLGECLKKEKKVVEVKNQFEELKEFLL